MITATGRRRLAGLLAVAFVIAGCSRGDDAASDTTLAPQPSVTAETGEAIVTVDGSTVESEPDQPRLGVELSDGATSSVDDEPVAVAAGDPLSADDVGRVFESLPGFADEVDEPTDESDFERPAETLLPPETGRTVDEPFPPPADEPAPDAAPSGPLEVLRYQPQGDVDLAPFVTATFSEPMVPVASLAELDAADVPMEISPEVEGRWRWLGTRTVRFEAVPGDLDRLPDATTYTVTIPAGTESSNGAVLRDEVTWTFSTPAVELVGLTGTSDSMPTDPVWVATFNQRVDAQAALTAIGVTAGGEPVELQLAGDSDLERDDEARHAFDSALPDRAVAFTPATELPIDSAIAIEIGPNVPSAEGPRTSAGVERFTGRTFGALRVSRSECGWGDGCVPGSPFIIEFSNRLDPDEFSADLVTIDPAIPGLHIDVYDSVIEISGTTTGQTTYRVTLDGDLTDVFGQRLGDDTDLEFDVGSALPGLRGLEREFITTDPGAEQATVSITTINHDDVRVRAWAVTPAQLVEYREYTERMWSDAGAEVPEDWIEVMDDEVEIDNVTDTFVETSIDLTGALDEAGGEVVVRVDPTIDVGIDDDLYWRNQPTVSWVQRTTLAVDAVFDNEKLVIATNDLLTGEPVTGVPVELLGDGRVATTGEEGLVELDLGEDEVIALFANAGDRTALLSAERWGGWQARTDSPSSRWYVFDDRGIYRPGETAHITGWARRFVWTEGTRLELYPDDVTVEFQVYDAQGADLAEGTAELSGVGGFSFDVEIPDGANLGPAWVEMTLVGADDSASYQHSFQVQEFRRPEFEVTTRAETPPPYYDTRPATVAVDAEYFSGAPLPDAEVNWLVTTRETTYAPPDWDEYTFGVWQPWWFAGGAVDRVDGGGFAGDVAVEEPMIDECFDCWPPLGDAEFEEFAGRTDATGTHLLQIDFDGEDVDLPSSVTAEATVFDVNRQAWASRTDLLVHPAEYYVGVRTDRNFVEPGTPIRIDAVVTDIDGGLAPGHPVEITSGRVEWGFDGSTWTEELVDTRTCTFDSTTVVDDDSMRCEFETEVGGTYRITAIVTDEEGQTNRSEITQWVSGGPSRPVRNVEHEQLTIVPDRESYTPGDTAELLVQAPFAPAYGILTTIHHGIVTSEAFEAPDGSAVVEVPIDENSAPNLSIQVDMNGSTARTDDEGNPLDELPPRTAYATGTIQLPVPPTTRTLDVTVTPDQEALEPGDDTSVTVTVDDAAGEPVAGAEVAVVVVDEAVLALTDYELADPLDAMYADLWSTVQSRYFRSTVLLSSTDELASGGVADSAADGDDMAEESAEEPAADLGADRAAGAVPNVAGEITIRSDFDPVAVYAPGEVTGDDGTVTVDVPLPDNLTRYRVLAVAAHDADQFGKGESSITARLPLMVRPSAPRFLNYGDRFELPVVLQNQTDEPLEVDVAVQVANLTLVGGDGLRVTVPANDRVEVRFPALTASAGTARVRVAAVSGTFTDATDFSLPVYTPATSEAFATYGVIDDEPIAQPLTAPDSVIPEFGGLEIGTSSTALQTLTDSMLYLVDYEYESSDGYASRIMAVASLREVLEAFDAEGLPDPDELDAQVARDITRLAALQNDDGGFPYWQRGRQSIPWNSIQSTHALLLAEQAGYAVPVATLDAALDFIAAIEEHTPTDYSEDVKRSLSAYALYVRDLAGDTDTPKAGTLFDTVGDDLELDALAWIWPSITGPDERAAIERRFVNSAVETPGGATFATDYGEDAYVIAQSDTRTDGVILDALITQAPDSDLIPKVVNGLLGRRTNGRWSNDQENSFVLVAMKRYFDTFEATDPSFVARAWIDDVYVAEAEFLDRTTERANTVVPMAALIDLAATTPDDGPSTLTLAKDGDGRLYYRLGLTYAPSDLQLDARDEGFVVERTYLPVDDDADVSRDENGHWHIRAGATVRVRVTMVADARRTHVALVDPLPAGLEPVNPDLAVSQTIPPDETDDEVEPTPQFWWWNWFEHQNLRDDRAEAFASYLDGGTYEYTYVARATTPGTFTTPPATAEEIYSPEVFGRSATDLVIVE